MRKKADNTRKQIEETLCPGNDFGCPYYTESGVCALENPAHECDDYQYYTGCCDEE